MNISRFAGTALAFGFATVSAFAQVIEFVPNQILVKFKGATASIAMEAANRANATIGASTLTTIPKIVVAQIKVPSGMSRDDALFYYSGRSDVLYAEPIAKKSLLFNPNDPQFVSQYGPKKVKCPEAWDIGKGAPSTVIAVIDTGIDLNHEDLKNKLVPGYDFSDNDNDPTAAGDHGVHTAGIAAADTNNGKGVVGAGFNCKIMPLKIFPNATDAASASAMIFAADNGAKVISLSYGAYFASLTEQSAVNYAWGKGVVLVGGAANDNVNNKFYPGAFTNVICVGSTGTSDVKSGFSNWGADWVDVAAPGENILSTVTGGYANFTGTSMSTPLVAGVVGLLKSTAIPGTTNAQIRAALENNTDPVPGNFFKFGRINAYKAIVSLDPGSVTQSNATAVASWFGNSFSGIASDLTSRDGARVIMNSINHDLGNVAGATVEIGLNGASTNLNLAQVVIEANAPSAAAGQVFLWNYSLNKFVLVKAFPLYPSGIKQQKIVLPKVLTPYVSAGKLTIGIRGVAPNKPLRGQQSAPYELSLDLVRVETRENPAPG